MQKGRLMFDLDGGGVDADRPNFFFFFPLAVVPP